VTPKKVIEHIVAFGHANMQATHPTTLMITKEADLSKQGDCVIAVAADKAVADLSAEFKDLLRKPNAKLIIQIEVDGSKELIHAEGNPNLTLADSADIVVRKSEFLSNRTLAVHSDKAAKDLSKELIGKLRNPKQKATIMLTIETES
jgi:hypothetical protein